MPNPVTTKITIGGNSGTGKGTVASLLAKQLDFSCYSAGDFFREIAKARGFESVNAFQQSLHGDNPDDDSVDREVDARTKQFGEASDRFVVEGRLCAHMIPQGFNVLLTCDDMVRFTRIAQREGISVTQVEHDTREREALYTAAYQRFYAIDDYLDAQYYDLVIDTTDIPPAVIVDRIIGAITKS